MYNTQLISLLKTFSAYEMNSFGKFVVSPFFNKNGKIISLYKILEKEHPKFIEAKLEKEKVYKKIYPKQKYDDKKMRYLTYEMLNLAQKFLGINVYLRGEQINPISDVLTALGEKEMKGLFEKKMSRTEEELDITQKSNIFYFYNKWNLSSLRIRYQYFNYSKNMDSDDLISSGEGMVMFSIVCISYIYFNLSITHHAINSKIDSFIIDDFIQNIDLERMCTKAKEINHPYAETIEVYYCLIMMIIKEDEETFFFRLKGIMETHPKTLVKEDKFNIYTNLCAYCSKQILRGNQKFARENFEIYKSMLMQNIYTLKDGLNLGTVNYHNILLLSLYLKEFEWTENFIKEYNIKIIEYEQANMLNIGWAYLNFEKGNYEDVFLYVSKIKPDHFFLKYEIRQITLRTYYELNQMEPVLTLIDSSKHFLNKNKLVSDERRIPFSNFLRFLGELVKLKLNEKYSELNTLEKEISSENLVIRKNWLLQKIRELRNKNK